MLIVTNGSNTYTNKAQKLHIIKRTKATLRNKNYVNKVVQNTILFTKILSVTDNTLSFTSYHALFTKIHRHNTHDGDLLI